MDNKEKLTPEQQEQLDSIVRKYYETKTKESQGSQVQAQENIISKYMYPHERVDLVSGGIFYPEDHILACGKIDLKYMTAKEEDILTSENLIKKNEALDMLLRSVILTTPLRYDDILLGDKMGILVSTRIMAYGHDYKVEVKCPNCEHKNNKTIDLRELETVEPKEELFESGVLTKHSREARLKLPGTGADVVVKFFNHADEKKVESEIKALKNKIGTSNAITTRLRHAIVEVNGSREMTTIAKFVSQLPSVDSMYIRKFFKENAPDVKLEFNFQCENCGHEERMNIPMTAEFFFPTS